MNTTSKVRKIIFLNRFFYPDHAATSQMLTDLAFYLADQGETVHVISSRLCYDDPTVCLPDQQRIHGVLVHRTWTSHFGRHFLPGRAIDYLTFHLTVFLRLLRITSQHDLVVVKTDPPLLSVTVMPVVWWRGARLLTWNQDLFPDVAQRLGVRGVGKGVVALLKGLRNRSLRFAACNVVPGEGMSHQLQQEGIAAEKRCVIHNWSDGQLIKPLLAEQNPLRQAWQLNNRFVVGYSGNLGRAHEYATLLAAAKLLQHREDIVFVCVGGGAGQKKLATIVQQQKVKNIQFKPYQPREKLSLSLGVADVHWISLRSKLGTLIVPSKFYGIAAAGRAMIYIGDIEDDIPALLREAACGVTIAIGDGHALAQQIKMWADDRQACQRAGRAARQLFEARFDQPLALAAWDRLIQESKQHHRTDSRIP